MPKTILWALAMATASIMTPTVGMAAEMPRFNVPAYCARVADTVGGSDMIREGCLEQEQSSYNELKPRWASVPERTQAYCVNVAQTIGGSYQILEGCLTQEASSGDSVDSFEFQY